MLKIRDWIDSFESSIDGKRPIKRMLWASLPCDLQSRGYLLLMASDKGPYHLGVFTALIQVVAMLPKAIRDGRLIDGQERPLPMRLLALKTHISEAMLAESIEALRDVEWIEGDTVSAEDSPKTAGDLPIPSAESPSTGQDKTGQDKTEPSCSTPSGIERARTPVTALKGKALTIQQEAWFAEWWRAYWRHVARAPAGLAFGRKVKTEECFQAVMAATRAQAPEMMSRPSDKRPHGATWLNAERWNDEAEQCPAGQPAKQQSVFDAAMDRLDRNN